MLPQINLLFDTAFVSQNLNISQKIVKCIHSNLDTPYWKLYILPREVMTSIFHLSNSNNVINRLFTNIPVICDGVCLLHNEAVHQLFIDFKKAYDSVRREALYNILVEFGIPKKLVRLIKMSD